MFLTLLPLLSIINTPTNTGMSIRFMESSNIIKKFLMDSLPDECLIHIFSFLPHPRDRCTCAAVAKKWLFLQLHMRPDHFRHSKVDEGFHEHKEVSRSLEGTMANDVRLASMLVGVYPNTLTVLYLLQGFPSSNPVSPRQHKMVTDLGLKIVGFACPNLKSITLSNCTLVGDAGLACVARGCRLLEKLCILRSRRISDVGLSAVAESCSCLSMVRLESCPSIGNRSLEALARHSVRLESITLIKCHRIGDSGIISVLTSLPKLANLSLIMMEMGDAVLRTIGEDGKALEMLRLESVKGPTEKGYSFLKQSHKLSVLALVACPGLIDTSFTSSAPTFGFTSLTKLAIKNCSSLTDLSLIELAKGAHNLEILEVQKLHEITTTVLFEALLIMSKTLRKLSLVQCDLIERTGTKNGADQVGANLVLQSLKLKRCNGVGEALLSWMGAACRQAAKVALTGMSSVADPALCTFLKSLDGTGHVTSLDLSGCVRISDWGVMAMMIIVGRKLKRLNLSGCSGLSSARLGMLGSMCPNLQDLDMSQCAVGDETLKRLSSAGELRLRTLALAGCDGITDEGLTYLEVMSASLDGLNLNSCSGISGRGIECIRASLWWCDLIS